MNPSQTKSMARCLVGFAAFLTLLGLFYTEENWRGKRAWENCKRALEAQGVKMDWADYIPAPVPSNENVFGVPEMQKWFTGRGDTALTKHLIYPEFPFGGNTNRIVVAELSIGLPGARIPSNRGSNVLDWGNPHFGAETAILIRDALGPLVCPEPCGADYMLRSPEEIRPAQIVLQCQTAPTVKALLEALPKPMANTNLLRSEDVRVESLGDGTFKVTMIAPDTVAEFLNWSDQLEPEMTIIRKALQRPYARVIGDYSEPSVIPIPNFLTIRAMVQTLAAMAQCHLVQGKPQAALRDLTLMHDLCRMLEGGRPMTLLAAMIDVAVSGFYASTIADGLPSHVWREPQLAALEEQLKQINLLSPVKQALEVQRVSGCRFLETARPALFFNGESEYNPSPNAWTALKASVLGGMIPRGWTYQNMVAVTILQTNAGASLNPDNQIILPDKADAAGPETHPHSSYWSPYTFMTALTIPNSRKAVQACARNQTMVNQALIACALERYHLAHAEYPETLDALIPQFLEKIPRDVIGGRPPHYRRAADGTFLLYSIGWNGRDGGGARGKSIGHGEGDWVWPD
jgi:hypothetical protein